MKRIILSLNNNPTYEGFWPIVSNVWRKFGFIPTLSFLGTDEERRSMRLEEHGEVITLSPDFGVKRAVRDWRVTWGLFYAASLFPNDTCMTHGIDQIPLSRYFDPLFLYEGEYVIGLRDAYPHPSIFPSSHHVALGETFKSELKIEDAWKAEIEKVEKYGVENHLTLSLPYFDKRTFWGLDEVYSSEILSGNPLLRHIPFFFNKVLLKNRLDRGGALAYSVDKLRVGGYSEIHCPRPPSCHREYLQAITENITYE